MNKIIAIVTMLVLSGCSVVGPGHKGVSVNRGTVGTETLSTGWYLWIPFVRNVKSIDVRVQKTEDETEAASKDMQMVKAKIAINWHIDPANVHALFGRVGDEDDVINQIINPAVSETLKAATAQMTAEEILSRRIELKKNIDNGLINRLRQYYVMVDDISLVNLSFSEHYSAAIEAKQVAEQRAQQAEYEAKQQEVNARGAVAHAKGQSESNAELAKGEAKAMLTRAEAEAKSKHLLQETLTPQILQLEYLKRWDGSVPSVVTSGSGLMLNMSDMNKNLKGTKTKGETNE